LGGRKGIRPVKTERWGAGVVICLERGADLHMAQLMPLTVSCFSKIQIGFTFWYRLTWVVPDKGPLNGMCVLCVTVTANFRTFRIKILNINYYNLLTVHCVWNNGATINCHYSPMACQFCLKFYNANYATNQELAFYLREILHDNGNFFLALEISFQQISLDLFDLSCSTSISDVTDKFSLAYNIELTIY